MRWREPNWAYWKEQPSFWPSDLAYLGANIEPPAKARPFPLAIVERAAGWLAAHGLYPYDEDPATGAMTLLPVSKATVLRVFHKSAPPAGLFDGFLERIEPSQTQPTAPQLQQLALIAAHHKLALPLNSSGDCAFSAAELLEHARAPEARTLHDAVIAAAGALNSKKLGQFLRTFEGVAADGLEVRRVGVDKAGVVWCVKARAF